jgi:hypothetical protein
MNKPTVFISYSHKDEIWKNLRIKYLKSFLTNNLQVVR